VIDLPYVDEPMDVCDENNNLVGVEMDSVVHRDGLWHRVCHLFLYNSAGEVMLQLRAKDKWYYPDVWDVSAGGHLSVGEDMADAAAREGTEELGTEIRREDLHFFEVKKFSTAYNSVKPIKNNEFCYAYLLRFDGSVEELNVEKEELQRVRFFSEGELEEEIKANPGKFMPYGSYFFDVIREARKLLRQ